ncbi:RluA family pseudouridine synthase [Zongyangia hominis]|uniref:Pseudouridine synthase n=1 Tax=Zongyangia hominis TaxID=2763677 RepID=A0A926EBK1_9FIRM|nr:RluA family pseudouridine synthase [Zongyangia hominis]MBC8570053.1 RluA family pseudouridine synthase [Zongyangia hominis]
MRVIEWLITPEQEGRRLDDLLKREYGLSSTVVKCLKRAPDGITLDGEPARVIDRVRAGQSLCLRLPDERREMTPCFLPVPIPYEDEDFLVFDKPPHMPVHQAHEHQEETLANVWAGVMGKRLGYVPVFHPINRLDKDTSGLVLCAKNALCASLDPRQVEKRYTAIVTGVLSGTGVIDAPIGMLPGSKVLRCVRPDGSRARTHYESLCTNGVYTLVQCRLETGRTHQIRVHMVHLGHPLAGDELYGGSRDHIGRQALHCGWMRFCHPLTRRWVEVSAPLDTPMQKLADQVCLYSQYE